jgi:hypothetical protein
MRCLTQVGRCFFQHLHHILEIIIHIGGAVFSENGAHPGADGA